METNSLSVKEIRCKYQHNKFYDGYLVDHFCQIFSPYFTWLFVRLGWTPNYVTSLMIIFGILGATFFVIPSLSFKIVGVLFIYLWYIMDISDGEVARATKTFSKFGQEFDYTAHVINHPLFVLSFTLCIIQANILYGLLIVGLGLVDMIFRNLVAFNSIKMLKESSAENGTTQESNNSLLKFMKHIFLSIITFPNFVLVFPVLFLWDTIYCCGYAFVFLCIVLLGSILVTFLCMRQWLRTVLNIY
ncbi:CDP-alcohol phosphatidyltransferase family protein [Bacteroides fragilis]